MLKAIGMAIGAMVEALLSDGGTDGTADKPPPKDERFKRMDQKPTQNLGISIREARHESCMSVVWHHWSDHKLDPQ